MIDSGGGDENAALDAAEVILARRLPVTVRGQCTSACANAVFAAGATRTIERAGFVSFHHSSPVIEANYQKLKEAVPDEIARGARRLRALYAARGVDPGILACAAAQIGLSDIQTQVTIPGEATPRAAWLSRHSLWLPHEATLRRYGLDFTRWGRPPSRRDVLARLRPPQPARGGLRRGGRLRFRLRQGSPVWLARSMSGSWIEANFASRPIADLFRSHKAERAQLGGLTCRHHSPLYSWALRSKPPNLS